MPDMSKNRQQRRSLRGPTVPVPTIVATAPVAVAPRPAVSAPEFPGVSDADTPIFDQLLAGTRCTVGHAEAEAMLAEPFLSWGLDEIAPLPIETLIKDLTAQVGEGTAWVIESEVGHAVLAHRFAQGQRLGEEDNDGQPDDGPTGDADVADGSEGPPVVGSDAPDREHPEGQG